MRLPAVVLALAVSTFVAIPLHAQSRRAIDDEIARQGYEALGQQIGAALQAAGEVKRSLAESNVDIQQARQRFWKDYDAGVRNGPAELAFGRKLLGKDIVLVSLNISEGTQGTTMLGFTALFGKLDGGIPEPARPFFDDWVNAIRYLLGADRPGSLVMATPSQLGIALEKTRQWYDVYRQWRDWSEFKAHGITRPFPTREAPDEHALAKLRPSRAREWRVASQQVWAPVVGYPLLRCVYEGADDRGTSRTQLFFFWHEKVRMTREQLQAAVAGNPQSGFAIYVSESLSIGSTAVSECPAEMLEASRLSRVRDEILIEGKWALRRQGGDETLNALFGGSTPAQTVEFIRVGKLLHVYSSGFNGRGVGEFDGRKGFYETVDANGARARTELLLDENGVLHGKVRGTGVHQWDFVGKKVP